jgi:hypothetical protein
MNNDQLRNLIEKADAGTAPSGVSAENLSNLSRIRLRQICYRRLLAASAAIMMLLCGFISWQLALRQPGENKIDVDAINTNLADLQQQIDQYEQNVDQLLAAERYQRLKSQSDDLFSKSFTHDYLNEQLWQAAGTIVIAADQENDNPRYKQSTRKSYQLVINTFPQTTWADQARARLAALGTIEE